MDVNTFLSHLWVLPSRVLKDSAQAPEILRSPSPDSVARARTLRRTDLGISFHFIWIGSECICGRAERGEELIFICERGVAWGWGLSHGRLDSLFLDLERILSPFELSTSSLSSSRLLFLPQAPPPALSTLHRVRQNLPLGLRSRSSKGSTGEEVVGRAGSTSGQ
jgi:hypothetical protein